MIGALQLPQLSRRRKFRLMLRAISIVIGAVSAYVAAICIQEKKYAEAVIPTLLVIFAALAEFVLADVLTESLYPAKTEAVLERLETNLRQYHDRIRQSIVNAIGALEACDKARVSGTFHLIVDSYSPADDSEEKALVQVIDYSGRLGGKRWRFTPSSKGLIGRCLRTGKAEWVNFATADEYKERMVAEFGFERSDLSRHTRQARSYWAEPVFLNEEMIGVIYLFSTEIQVFPMAIDQKVMAGVAREIAAYLDGTGLVRQ